MNTELIKELIGEFKASNLTKLKLSHEGFELELEREKEIVVTGAAQMQMMAAPTALSTVAHPSASPVIAPEANVVPSPKVPEGHSINAPMVGTFYASTSPDSKPFVQIGTKVKKGDVVCILEAMKLMNEVEADCDGEVIEILAQNEDMVEFNQPMFIIK